MVAGAGEGLGAQPPDLTRAADGPERRQEDAGEEKILTHAVGWRRQG